MVTDCQSDSEAAEDKVSYNKMKPGLYDGKDRWIPTGKKLRNLWNTDFSF